MIGRLRYYLALGVGFVGWAVVLLGLGIIWLATLIGGFDEAEASDDEPTEEDLWPS